MECVEIKSVEASAKNCLNTSAEARTRAIAEPYDAEDAVRAVRAAAEEQMVREAETRAMAPEAYRLSAMSDISVGLQYRRGKQHMSSADLVRYIADTRAAYLQSVDLTDNAGADLYIEDQQEGCTAVTEVNAHETRRGLTKICRLPALAGGKLRAAWPTWFDKAEPDTSENSRRFPLSAFAAMLAVAMSLLLIVASSVMVRLAESDVSRLKTKISDAAVVAEELKSDLEVGNDFLEIRQIATEEYGMVAEDYVKMDYISLGGEDNVEVYEEEREKSVGLSALLSAIGLK